MIKLEELKLNNLILIDNVIYELELVAMNLLNGTPYRLPNRQDIIDALNKLTESEE